MQTTVTRVAFWLIGTKDSIRLCSCGLAPEFSYFFVMSLLRITIIFNKYALIMHHWHDGYCLIETGVCLLSGWNGKNSSCLLSLNISGYHRFVRCLLQRLVRNYELLLWFFRIHLHWLRHSAHELQEAVHEKIQQFLAKHKDIRKACKALNDSYMNSPGFYPVTHFRWRGEDVQCQLSHPPCPTDPCPLTFTQRLSTSELIIGF